MRSKLLALLLAAPSLASAKGFLLKWAVSPDRCAPAQKSGPMKIGPDGVSHHESSCRLGVMEPLHPGTAWETLADFSGEGHVRRREVRDPLDGDMLREFLAGEPHLQCFLRGAE